MTISKIKKNSLEANIIDEELVTADVITEQTELSSGAASNDTVLIYDTSVGALRKITQTNLLNFPTVSSVSPTNATSGDGTGNHTFVITGTGFTGATASLINSSGTTVSFDSQTADSDTQITGVIAKSSLPGSGEPYDVRVAAASGLASSIDNQINIDQSPVFSTAAGSLGSIANGARGSTSFTVVAADPESGGDVVYTLESGSLPAGCSLTSTSSGAVLSGFDAVGTNTTSTFTIRAKDAASNVSDRQFTITVNAPVSQSFTSSGTFSVPSGVAAVDVLVVAGGGSGADIGTTTTNRVGGAGGGAGGLIYRPAFPVTPGGTVSVTVGCGGAKANPSTPTANASNNGQDSVFGTLTAKGGGGGGAQSPGSGPDGYTGKPGGSGGGGGTNNTVGSPGGTAIQPTQPGDSGTYGFGNSGGLGTPNGVGGFYGGAGGGGAGAAGQNAQANCSTGAGRGGIGRAYTIADNTTSVYYAGGGAGGVYTSGNPTVGGQGGGGAQPGSQGNCGAVRNGTTNRGGGGAAGMNNHPSPDGSNGQSGVGGKGIVIVRY